MKQFDFVVQTSVGIHARPAMQLVNMTKKFQSDIKCLIMEIVQMQRIS